MKQSIQKGKTLVIAIIAAVLILSLINITVIGTLVSEPPTIEDAIRFLLSIALCYFLYQGQGWARWVLGVLLALGGFAAIPSFFLLFQVSFLGAVWLLIMGISYLGCSWFLLRSPEVKSFLAYRRARQVRSS